MSKELKCVVSAMIADVPGQGGWAWVVLQFLLGLKRLGHRVLLYDELSADHAYIDRDSFRRSPHAKYFFDVLQPNGLVDNATLVLNGTQHSLGIPYESVMEFVQNADVLLNISGRWHHTEMSAQIPTRIYFDLDPAFTQLWQVAHGIDMRLKDHTHHVTVGLAIGKPSCKIPTCGIDWITMNQPIVLEHWPMGDQIKYDGLTTVANWRGYGSAEYEGVFFGQKAHSLRQLIDLPRRTDERLILALGIHPDEKEDLAALEMNGWQLLDPASVASTPWNYRRFVQESKGEFGIAKSGYVLSQCGWFSDRSVCYLASGRPVIAQDTGFSRFLPTGEGLFTFHSAEEVLAALDALNANYEHQRRAARRIAEEYFDSDKVLTNLLKMVGAI